MKKIAHFHPSASASSRFVLPLVEEERSRGFESVVYRSDLLSIFQCLAVGRPDIVIAHNSRSSILPLLLGRLCGVKRLIYFNHGVPFIGYRGTFLGMILRLCELVSLSLCDETITVSKTSKFLLKKASMRDSSVRIIESGSCCGLQIFEIEDSKSHCLRDTSFDVAGESGLCAQDLLLLFVGRAVSRKGYDFIINVFKDPSFVKEVFGKRVVLGLLGSSVAEFERRFGRVPQDIIPIGFKTDPTPWFHRADLLVLPSSHEGYSYVVLEAFASELSVMCSDVPGLRETAGFGRRALLIPLSYQSWIEAINDFFYEYANPAGGDNLSSAIRNRAKIFCRKFERQTFLRSYMEMIDEQ